MFVSNVRVVCAGLVAAFALAFAASDRGAAAPVPADRLKAEQATRAERLKADKERAVVAARMCGAWECMCKGRLELRANGTYEWTDIQIGEVRSNCGYWSLRGSPDVPNLVLHCTVANARKGRALPPDVQGKTTEWKIDLTDKDQLTLEEPDFIPFYREKP